MREVRRDKVKLATYKMFGKNVEFKKYLHGVSDAGTRQLFGSGMHGLNEELEKENWNLLCVSAECESVVHVLWECSAYSNRASGAA